MTAFDTILLGSSPNALVAAAYLARAGQRVLVLEASAQLGGVVVTTQFADNFRADLSFMSGRLDAGIVRDLELEKHGLEVIERNTITALLPARRSFTLPANRDAAVEVIGRFSAHDAARYRSFMHLLDLASDLLQAAYNNAPPQAYHPGTHDSEQLLALLGRLRGYGRREMTEVMRLLVMSARDLLEEWFESAELKGMLASVAVRGAMQGPFAAGTTFNLLHHLAIGDGLFRVSAKGGVGAISRALATAAARYGAELRTNAGAKEIVVSDGVATGVKLDSGELIEAAHIISDYDARFTFTKLVPPFELEPEFNRAVQQTRLNGGVARINLALRELPALNVVGDTISEAALAGTLVVAPSLAYLEKAYDCAKYGNLSDRPYLEVTIPSITDPTLAPAGSQVMSIWLQYAPYRGEFDHQRLLEAALASLSEFAPDLRSLVLHAQVLSPRDFAAQFNLSAGDLYGGEMSPTQAFFLRPIPGYAQYRTPIAGLYLCGAATHPGGGVSGLNGRNAANQIRS